MMSIGIGIIGFGTVGAGTAAILQKQKYFFKNKLSLDIELLKVADLDIKTDRGINISESILTTDVSDVIDNPDIDIVVELIGGLDPAQGLIEKALSAGKHVVTDNKYLMAERGPAIIQAAANFGADIFFEAAVAGSIPVIKTLKESYIGNEILSLYGIINGTANYILTEMTEKGSTFSEALSEAQKLGYAEADPTFDIEGNDSAHKLCIMTSLAYGANLVLSDIPVFGITGISKEDILFAAEFGYRIKLLAISKKTDEGIEVRVAPTMIPANSTLAGVNGAYNAVFLNGDSCGPQMLYGQGAGRFPTASAVISDIIDAARNIKSGCPGRVPSWHAGGAEAAPGIRNYGETVSKYYFRFRVDDRPGVLAGITGVLGDCGISVESCIQKNPDSDDTAALIITTHDTEENNVQKAVCKIDSFDYVKQKTAIIRIEDKL
ncbi:MAG: homoserine dehydrogenase [Fibrobacterota bacterium]